MTLKFLLVGDSSVGKTSIMYRITEDKFDELVDSTVGVDFVTQELNIDGNDVRVQIWDTAGQEKFKSLGKAYYRNSVGVFFVFSLDNHQTFESIKNWYKDVIALVNPKAIVAIVGNKSDLVDSRAVTTTEAENLANSLQIPYYETSAKTGSNVKESFNQIIRKIYRLVLANEIDLELNMPVVNETGTEVTKKGCC